MTLDQIFSGTNPWLGGLLVIGSACLAGYLAHRAGAAVIGRYLRDKDGHTGEVLFRHLRRPLGLFIPAAAGLLALPLIPAFDGTELVRHGLVVLAIAAIGWGTVAALRASAGIIIGRFRIDHADNLAQRQVQTRVLVFTRIGAVVVVVITTAAILMTFPGVRHVGISLFASAGVAGLVIGLAARPTIANLIAGIQVALTQPIRVDDVVIIENEWGWIEEITTTYVVVRIWDQRRLIVPLSQFIEKPFQNWTRRTADIIGTIFIHADYTVPIEPLREELSRLARANPRWDGKVCLLQVTDATPKTMELRALVTARNSPDAWDLRCELREGLITFLQKNYPECLPRLRAEVADPQPGGTTGATPAPQAG